MPTKDDIINNPTKYKDKPMTPQQIDERVRMIHRAIRDTNYMGEVMEIIYNFLYEYAIMCEESNTATLEGTTSLIHDYICIDLMVNLKEERRIRAARKKI